MEPQLATIWHVTPRTLLRSMAGILLCRRVGVSNAPPLFPAHAGHAQRYTSSKIKRLVAACYHPAKPAMEPQLPRYATIRHKRLCVLRPACDCSRLFRNFSGFDHWANSFCRCSPRSEPHSDGAFTVVADCNFARGRLE